jgi:hypothetical protein
VEIDVWDGEPPSSSSSEDEAANLGVPKAKKEKKEKSELSLRKRLELRFSRKGSEEKKELSQSPPKVTDERVQPWRSNSSRAEPRVLHGMGTSELHFFSLTASRLHSDKGYSL